MNPIVMNRTSNELSKSIYSEFCRSTMDESDGQSIVTITSSNFGQTVDYLIVVEQNIAFTEDFVCDSLYLIASNIVRASPEIQPNIDFQFVIGNFDQLDSLLQQINENSISFNAYIQPTLYIDDDSFSDLTLTYCDNYFEVSSSSRVFNGKSLQFPYSFYGYYGFIINPKRDLTIKIVKSTTLTHGSFRKINLTIGNTYMTQTLYYKIFPRLTEAIKVTLLEEGWTDNDDQLPTIISSCSNGFELDTQNFKVLARNFQKNNPYEPTFNSVPNYQFFVDYQVKLDMNYYQIYCRVYDGEDKYIGPLDFFITKNEGFEYLYDMNAKTLHISLELRCNYCVRELTTKITCSTFNNNIIIIDESQIPDGCYMDQYLAHDIAPQFDDDEMEEILNEKLPKVGFIIVTKDEDDDELERMESHAKDLQSKMCKAFEGEDLQMCEKAQTLISDIYFANDNQMSNKLGTVDSKLDILCIDIKYSTFLTGIEFLPSKMTVIIGDLTTEFENKANSLSFSKFYRYIYKELKNEVMEKSKYKEGYITYPKATFQVSGYMKKKVSYLILVNARVTFIQAPCDAEYVFLTRSLVDGFGLANKHLIAGIPQIQSICDRLSKGRLSDFKVKQPALYSPQKYGETIFEELTIEYYDKEKWKITTSPANITGGDIFIPYNLSQEAFGFVLNLKQSLTINIVCNDKSLASYMPLTFTVGRTVFGSTYSNFALKHFINIKNDDNNYEDTKVLNKGANLLADDEKVVTVKASGWGNKKPNFITIIKSPNITVQDDSVKQAGLTIKEEEQKNLIFTEQEKDEEVLPTPVLIGIIVAVVVVVALVIVILVYFFACRKKKSNSSQGNEAEAL